jgi:decaprenylphospho-beta-D-ribofuranose 2-oxidase
MTTDDCSDPPVSSAIEERHSYDGCHSTLAKVYAPQCLAELAERLRKLSADHIGRLTICAGCQSIDGQALGDRVVIQLGGADLCRIGAPQQDERGWYVTLGAAAKWGDVLAALAEHGVVPYSVVTTSHATVGGTVSADCLSRSSPLTGREGRHVRSFKMLTVDGETLECRRDDPDPERRLLYKAVIGSFGYLGVLTEVTIDVRPPLPGWKPGRRIMVATRCDKHRVGGLFGGRWADFLPSLRERAAEADLTAEEPGMLDRLLDFVVDDVRSPESLGRLVPWDAVSSAAWYAPGGVEALVFRSRYVLDRGPRPLPIYQHASWLRDLLAMGCVIPAIAEIGEAALYALHPSGVYVDELADFTFFMENQLTPAKQAAGEAGWRLNTIQQTFILPATPAPDDSAGIGPTVRFLEQIPEVLFGDSVLPAMLEPMRPTLIDVLYLPADDFLLSATREMGGYAVSVTFAERNQDGWDTLQERLRALSQVCASLDGRVHLIKDVVVEQPLLEKMYRGAFEEFRALKRRYDPHGVLENGFYDRIFGKDQPVAVAPAPPGTPMPTVTEGARAP